MIPFISRNILKEHESCRKTITESSGEVYGTSLFNYNIELGKGILEISQTIGKIPECVNLQLVETLSNVLVESNEIFIQINLLDFFWKIIQVLEEVIKNTPAVNCVMVVIEKFLNPKKTHGSGILNIGKVIVTYLSSFAESPVEEFIAMVPMILERLHIVKSSDIEEALLYPFLHMCLEHLEETLKSMEDRTLQIFVDKMVNYIESGTFSNIKAKN